MGGKKEVTPITDPQEALTLLTNPWRGRWAGAYLYDGYDNDGEAYIEVMWAGREYESGTCQHYPIDAACAKTLVENYWVEGVPHMGWTDEHKFTISDAGRRQLHTWAKELEKEARDQLKVGIHGWSSLFEYKGTPSLRRGDRKDWKEGYLFVNPFGEHFMVFLPEKIVEKVDKKELGL